MKITNADISTLIQMREWLMEQIDVAYIRHKPTKELRAILVEVTAKILEMEKDGEVDSLEMENGLV